MGKIWFCAHEKYNSTHYSSGQVQVGFLGTMYITITKTSLHRMQSPDIMLQYIFLLRLMFYLVYKTYMKNSYFLHWNFDWKSCFVVFFLEWNEWKNPQFNFSSQNLSIERNFFKWDGKETKILHLLFHRIWKKYFLILVLFDVYMQKPSLRYNDFRENIFNFSICKVNFRHRCFLFKPKSFGDRYLARLPTIPCRQKQLT